MTHCFLVSTCRKKDGRPSSNSGSSHIKRRNVLFFCWRPGSSLGFQFILPKYQSNCTAPLYLNVLRHCPKLNGEILTSTDNEAAVESVRTKTKLPSTETAATTHYYPDLESNFFDKPYQVDTSHEYWSFLTAFKNKANMKFGVVSANESHISRDVIHASRDEIPVSRETRRDW